MTCIVIVLEREKECVVFENGSDVSPAEIQLSLTAVTCVGDVTCFGCAQSTHFSE
jgi:long-subunit acyl-CoA synthetase (AMP-forming)